MKYLEHAQTDGARWLYDLVDSASDLIQVVQLDGTLLYVNRAWSVTLGFSTEEILGQSIYSFILETDRQRYQEYRSQVIDGLIADMPIVFNLHAKSGQIIPVEGIVSVKYDGDVPLYTRGIFRDITVRLQNEAELYLLNEERKEREENMQQILMQAPDAVIVIDQSSRITFWNPKAADLFGWRAEEVLNQNLASTIIPHQHRDAHTKAMQRYLDTGEVHVLNRTIEITALDKRGNEFYVALTISATKQNGKNAFIAFLRDITKQKNSQGELELKTLQLEQSNAYLQDFAHAASHDLKEPLRKIRTFMDRLKRSLGSRLQEGEIKIVERVETSAERMQLLMDDLLEFSHVSSAAHELEYVDLNDKIAKIQVDLELAIEEKGATIKAMNLPTIFGNGRQLQQLFYNLISNALKYSKPGIAPAIEIKSRRINGAGISINIPPEHREKDFHLIEVQDNGIGFSQEYAEQIFDIFKRLHGKEDFPGTGIGLSITRKVVENHKGYIWAESQPGAGANFKVLLPL